MKILVLILILSSFCFADEPLKKDLIPKDLLISDTRLLVETIESVHPDPYIRGGGKIEFHRLFQKTLRSIPKDGMNREEYFKLLQPLVATVGDGHTYLHNQQIGDPYSPNGIPLYFETCTEGLYVAAVLKEEHRHLLGAMLYSVEGVSFENLIKRCKQIRGADNEYLLYRTLGTQGILWYGFRLKALIPEWKNQDSINVKFRLADNRISERKIKIPEKIDYASFIFPKTNEPELFQTFMSNIQRSDFFYTFLDEERQTCLLVIHNLMTYREAFEAWRSLGVTGREQEAKNLYQRFNGTAPPEDFDKVINGLPSITELLIKMTEEMKKSGTVNLLVDLSQNEGGSSLMSNILIYFLYGKDKLFSVKGKTTEIKKYSSEYFNRFPSPTLDEINSSQPIPLSTNDYDLTGDIYSQNISDNAKATTEIEEAINWMPTFKNEYESGKYNGYYKPKNVLVLCDAGTYSAAFTVMYYLNKCGAEIAGIPSAQAGNCFGDIINFELPNSKVKYSVSRKYFELFPEDNQKGKVLIPDYLMTYEKLTHYDFDPASLVRFAKDILNE